MPALRENQAANAALDKKVLAAVRKGVDQFMDICVDVGVSVGTKGDEFRTVDRSLQRLRRAGAIHFVKGKWERC
jgi:hypothetical protein